MKLQHQFQHCFFTKEAWILWALITICVFHRGIFAFDSVKSSKPSFHDNSLVLTGDDISNEFIDPGLLDLGATPVWLNFWLNWTHCQIHLSGYSEPVELILPGWINSNRPEILRLFVIDPQPGGLPKLYYINDVLGNPPPAETSLNFDIPLEWEISLDDGPFKPITLLPDNSLTTIFPPGQHDFQIRITCLIQPYQVGGYYHLQINQTMVPQL